MHCVLKFGLGYGAFVARMCAPGLIRWNFEMFAVIIIIIIIIYWLVKTIYSTYRPIYKKQDSSTPLNEVSRAQGRIYNIYLNSFIIFEEVLCLINIIDKLVSMNCSQEIVNI